MPSQPDPLLTAHYCFGCGRHNPIGMHLVFEREGEWVVARYRPRPEDQGFPGVMHGGLLGLLLDEAMSWAMYGDGVFAVTARMSTRFRRPTSVETPLTVRARLLRTRGRRIEVEAAIFEGEGGTGVPLVEAEGLFVRMSPQQEAAALATFRRNADGTTNG